MSAEAQASLGYKQQAIILRLDILKFPRFGQEDNAQLRSPPSDDACDAADGAAEAAADEAAAVASIQPPSSPHGSPRHP